MTGMIFSLVQISPFITVSSNCAAEIEDQIFFGSANPEAIAQFVGCLGGSVTPHGSDAGEIWAILGNKG